MNRTIRIILLSLTFIMGPTLVIWTIVIETRGLSVNYHGASVFGIGPVVSTTIKIVGFAYWDAAILLVSGALLLFFGVRELVRIVRLRKATVLEIFTKAEIQSAIDQMPFFDDNEDVLFNELDKLADARHTGAVYPPPREEDLT